MSKHALVVDDDVLTLSVTIRMLKYMGIHTYGVRDELEAIEFLRTAAPIDVVLTEVVMPQVSGWQVFTAARDRSASMPVIFVTRFIPKTLWNSVRLDVRTKVLDKPITFQQLETAVEAVMIG